jgi:hypothetical protein
VAWLQKTGHDRAWSKLPINKSSANAVAFFNASTYTVIGNGESTLFWLDSWLGENSIQKMAPTLFALIPCNIVSLQTVADGLSNGNWIRQIAGGLSMTAIAEYLTVWNAVQGQGVVLSDEPDKLHWRWSSDTVQSAYTALNFASHPIPGCDLIWETWAPLRSSSYGWPSGEDTGRPIEGEGTGSTRMISVSEGPKTATRGGEWEP